MMASSCIDSLIEKQKSQMTMILNWAKSQTPSINSDASTLSYCSTASINLNRSTKTSVSPLSCKQTKNSTRLFLMSPQSAENTEANSILDSLNNIKDVDNFEVIYVKNILEDYLESY